LGEFGFSSSPMAHLALATAVLFVVMVRVGPSFRPLGFLLARPWLTTGLVAGVAALLSLAYLAVFLRGGARIIDATAYLYQAKIFAAGQLGISHPEPTVLERGRFLFTNPSTLVTSVIFPPGYAALLAVGVWLGQPYLVGPLLAAGLVLVTARLAQVASGSKQIALLAGVLSCLSAALRYHTADTMSHGWSALLFAMAMLAAAERRLLVAGLCVGWLFATRPVTGVVASLAVLGLLFTQRTRVRSFGWLLLGLGPGVGFFLVYQLVSTGSLWGSTQLAYYAVADGPPGCFRVGFGEQIGCRYEHGDYVAARLPNGFGLLEAGWVTLLRLRWHLLDLQNFEPLALFLLLSLGAAWKKPLSRWLILGSVGVILGYLPFYFDGSYPGGGARMYADILPLEHVLLATYLGEAARFRWFVPLSLCGFALHGVHEHERLKTRDGGLPLFDSRWLEQRRIENAVVYVDTDHGFFLGNQPQVTEARGQNLVLRWRGDDHDAYLWKASLAERAYRLHVPLDQSPSRPRLEPYHPPEPTDTWRLEAESSWPVWQVRAGWVEPIFPSNACTSARRALRLHDRARLTLPLLVPETGEMALQLQIVTLTAEPYDLEVTFDGITERRSGAAPTLSCLSLPASVPRRVEKGERGVEVVVKRGDLALDYFAWLKRPAER